MTAIRTQIMDALLAHLRAQCGDTFLYYSRRFQTWEQVVQNVQTGKAPIRQPALFLFDGVGLGGGSDTYVQAGRGTPSIVTMSKTIVIYDRLPGGGTPTGPDAQTPGGDVFYSLQESVEDALGVVDSPSQGTLTLGDRVSHVWLSGQGMLMTGEIDEQQGQGMLTLPVEIKMWPRA